MLSSKKKLRVFRGGRAPNIDVWLECDEDGLAVESKLLEYLKRTTPRFSSAYERLAPPTSDSQWWGAYQDARRGAPQHIDRAQVIKHYFGLRALQRRHPRGQRLSLLYLFWEPLNWREMSECRIHREELVRFSEMVFGSQIPFRWTTYNEVWEGWLGVPELASHAKALKARYAVRL